MSPFRLLPNRRRCGLLLSVLCLPLALLADSPLASQLPETKHPSLLKLLKVALAQSPTTLNGNLDLAFAQAQAIGDNSQRLPQISVSGNYGIQTSAVGNGARSDKTGFYYNANLNQALYHWGALDAQREVGKIRVEIAQHRNADAYRSLVNSVRSQFLSLIVKKAQRDGTLFVLKRSEDQLKALEERFKLGAISPSEISEPQMALDELRVNAERVFNDYESTRRVLARTCGLADIDDNDIPDAPAKLELAPEQLDAAVQRALGFDGASSEAAKVYESQVRQFDREYFVASKRLYPKLNLQLSSNQQSNTSASSQNISQTDVVQQSAYLQADWHVFDGFATRSAKQLSLAQKRQAERNLKLTIERVNDQVVDLAKGVRLAAKAVATTERRLAIAEATAKRIEEDVKLGQVPPDQLLEFRRVLADVAVRAYINRNEFYTKVAELVSLENDDPLLLNLSTLSNDGQR